MAYKVYLISVAAIIYRGLGTQECIKNNPQTKIEKKTSNKPINQEY
jgi:hypothetical protein